jgi:hypothetical protein
VYYDKVWNYLKHSFDQETQDSTIISWRRFVCATSIQAHISYKSHPNTLIEQMNIRIPLMLAKEIEA